MNDAVTNRVAASESDLLSVTRALFAAPIGHTGGPHGGEAPPLIANLLRRPLRLAPGVGPTALRLIQDTMAKGIVLSLANRGGWRRADHLRDGELVSGRLWHRHEPPSFHLSPFAMELCQWLTRHPLRNDDCPGFTHTPATVADELLLYLALDLTHRARCADALASQHAARASALCWLGFPDVLARHLTGDAPPADISVYAFTSWVTGHGAIVLEALQADLVRRWIAVEHAKRRLGRAGAVIALGHIQDVTIDAYLSALTGARRHDLAGFMIEATSALLAERPDARHWQPAVERGESFRVRNEARRMAVSLLRGMGLLRRWIEEARAVRFFDDEYAASQLLLRQWEVLGDAGYHRCARIVRDIESIEALLDG